MTAIYPTIKLYIDLDGDNVTETDISNRIVSPFSGQHGILTNKDTDRLSNVGSCSFEIDNADGSYTDCASLIGNAIRITITVGSREKQIFYGYIGSAKIDPAEWGERRVHISVLDWFNIAGKSRVQDIALATFVTGDEAIPTLLDATPNPPQHTSLESGFERFPNMFDGALRKTSVYSELDKVVKSELGNLYLRFRPSEDGETLTFESYLHRGSKHSLSKVPTGVAAPSFIKWRSASDSGFLKWRSASDNGKIKLAEAQSAFFDRTMRDSEWEVGQNVINQMSVNQIPRKTDTTPVVLYSIDYPIRIGAKRARSSRTIKGTYSNPDGGTIIQAFDVVTPVATTDYTFNSAADGTGTNLTANISITFAYGTNGFRARIINNGAAGYLTFFQVRGKGIYKYSAIETLAENTESQNDIVKTQVSDSMTREYSDDYDVSETFANGVLAINRTPLKVMKSVSFLANISEHLMMAFMFLEQGDKVQIVESEPSHTGIYYIQGIKFRIDLGGIVTFTWYLKEAEESICEPIAVRSNSTTNLKRNAIDFGVLPYMANMQKFTYSFWIKRTANNPFGYIIAKNVDEGGGRRGHGIFISSTLLLFGSKKTPTDGQWEVTVSIPLNTWTHVAMTYDNTSSAADPSFYVAGSLVTPVTENVTPAGSTDDDADAPLVLFSDAPDPTVPNQEYELENRRFQLKDVRIYNRFLTTAEITELSGAEDDYSNVQDGLLFNGIFAPTENRDDYINDTITEQDLVLDIVHKAVGIPYNEDTSDETVMLYGLDL